MELQYRDAKEEDIDGVVALVNAAYVIERPWKRGDRTNAAQVKDYISSAATLLLAFRRRRPVVGKTELDNTQENQKEEGEGEEELVGCVYVRVEGTKAFFGMLAVWPNLQGQGLGSKILDHVEQWARTRGCTTMECRVVSNSPQLIPFYEKRGFCKVGTEPWEDACLLVPTVFYHYRKELATTL
jgi:GNAT superfamily N-acetyltransferase